MSDDQYKGSENCKSVVSKKAVQGKVNMSEKEPVEVG